MPHDSPASPTTFGLSRKLIIRLSLIALILSSGIYWVMHLAKTHHDKVELDLHGNVDIRQVDLGFRVGGRIAVMRVNEGDVVKQGDILAELDKAPYQHDLDSAKAQMNQAEANFSKMRHGSRPEEITQAKASASAQKAIYENAHRFAERQKQLVKSGSISQQDYDNAAMAEKEAAARLKTAQEGLRLQQQGFRKEDTAAAQAMLQDAKARNEAAQTNFNDTVIVSPSAGIIFTRVQEPGAIIAPGATVYTLSLRNPVWVRAYVDEPDLGRVKPGAEAEIVSDTYPDHPLKGKIGFISPQAEFTPKNIETKELRTDLVYRLRILVDDPEGKLRQGMPVTVKIRTPEGDSTSNRDKDVR